MDPFYMLWRAENGFSGDINEQTPAKNFLLSQNDLFLNSPVHRLVGLYQNVLQNPRFYNRSKNEWKQEVENYGLSRK